MNEFYPSQSYYTTKTFDIIGLSNFQYLQIEGSNDKVLKWMDEKAGIDWLLIDKDDEGYGVATRNRFFNPDKPTMYPDFTIRCELYDNIKSEYMKRTNSIKNNSMYPWFQMQSWWSASIFQAAAIGRTIDIYDFIKNNINDPKLVKKEHSNRPFYAVGWNNMKNQNYSVYITGSL